VALVNAYSVDQSRGSRLYCLNVGSTGSSSEGVLLWPTSACTVPLPRNRNCVVFERSWIIQTRNCKTVVSVVLSLNQIIPFPFFSFMYVPIFSLFKVNC
jgi:hypothetical protein